MIDKLCLKVPALGPLRPDLLTTFGDAVTHRFPRTTYAWSTDLRSAGIPATIHYDNRWTGSHKIDIHEVSRKSAQDILSVLEQLVCDDPLSLSVLRLDFAADVPGIRVSWFRDHAFVKYKRANCQYHAQDSPSLIDESYSYPSFRLETVYYGKGNCVRIYDKLQQLEHLARKGKLTPAGAQLLALYKAGGKPVTRVERQCMSTRIPKQLRTLGLLLANAQQYQPFADLLFIPGGDPLPSENDFPPGQYVTGMWIRQIIQKHGLAKAKTILNKRGGHAASKLKKYAAFIPGDPANFKVPDLNQLYLAGLKAGLLRDPDSPPLVSSALFAPPAATHEQRASTPV